jgi:hypothetical protein
MPTELIVRFPEVSFAEANVSASSLRDHLMMVDPDVEITQRRDSQDTMDLGTTLALVFGAPAVVVLAKGVADWLRRYRGAKVTILRADGSIVLENVTADVSRTAVEAALLREASNPSTDK